MSSGERLDPEQLAQIQLFESLTPPQVKAMASLMEVRKAPAGTTLIGEGGLGFLLFVLLDGEAAVTREDAEIASLGPGDFFGEIALLSDDQRRTATVTTTTAVTLAVMFGSDFRLFERDWPDAAALMRRAMNERLSRS